MRRSWLEKGNCVSQRFTLAEYRQEAGKPESVSCSVLNGGGLFLVI